MTREPPSPAPPRPVILDCDPGIDDAFAIVFGCAHPGLDLRGITTVAGNVSLDRTTANALSVLEFAGRSDVPVVPGSSRPLLLPPRYGSRVHGSSGLGAARLPAPPRQAAAGHAVDFLVEQVSSSPGEITLVATGPLTNIALALRRYPPLAGKVADFVIMGGSAARGNVSSAAEFNIATDPEAAAIVFGAGWRVTMVGLDVTMQARATPAVLDRMRSLGRLGADLLLPGLAGYRGDPPAPQPPVPATVARAAERNGPDGARQMRGAGRAAETGTPGATGAVDGGEWAAPGPPVHDVCALTMVTGPEMFGCLPARVEVETAGRWTSGMTVTDFGDTARGDSARGDSARGHNALVALSIDVAAFWDEVLGAYARLPVAGAVSPGPA